MVFSRKPNLLEYFLDFMRRLSLAHAPVPVLLKGQGGVVGIRLGLESCVVGARVVG